MSNGQHMALLLTGAAVVIALYVADMMGWPSWRRPWMARVYTKLLDILYMTVVPACAVGASVRFMMMAFHW